MSGLSAGFRPEFGAHTCARRGGITAESRFFGVGHRGSQTGGHIIKGSRAISKMQTSKGSLTTPRGGVWGVLLGLSVNTHIHCCYLRLRAPLTLAARPPVRVRWCRVWYHLFLI